MAVMNIHETQATQEEKLTCYRHPDRETLLRCNRCERPICTSCAISTPTGYRCPECVRGQEKKFDTAQIGDYIISILLAGGIALLGSFVSRFLGFFTLLIAPLASMLISEAILSLTRGRSSTLLRKMVFISAILGSLPLALIDVYRFVLFSLTYGIPAITSLLPLIWQAGYTIIMAASLRARLKGLYIG